MAKVTRLELATSGVTGQRSNQLSYTPLRCFALRRLHRCMTGTSTSQAPITSYAIFLYIREYMVGGARLELATPSV